MPPQSPLTIHTDGASRGNPGPAAFAYVIRRDDKPVIEEAGCLGRMTNNQAEYTALVRALERALKLSADRPVLVRSDSELLVKQMNGEYRVKDETLRDLYEEARALVRRFDAPVTIRHVRRDQNSRADELCNQALDGVGAPTPRGEGDAAPGGAVEPSLRQDALACLRQAGASPSAEAVWESLQRLLQRHGVRLPRR
jgi:ribonuclease HI